MRNCVRAKICLFKAQKCCQNGLFFLYLRANQINHFFGDADPLCLLTEYKRTAYTYKLDLVNEEMNS